MEYNRIYLLFSICKVWMKNSQIQQLISVCTKWEHRPTYPEGSGYGHDRRVSSLGRYWHNGRWKVFRIGTVRYNWPMSAHASQAFSIAHCTDSEDLPGHLPYISHGGQDRRVSSTRPCHIIANVQHIHNGKRHLLLWSHNVVIKTHTAASLKYSKCR